MLLQLPLLELVAAVDHQALNGGESAEGFGNESLAKAAGSAGDQDSGRGAEDHKKYVDSIDDQPVARTALGGPSDTTQP